jgi:hypothetical protein
MVHICRPSLSMFPCLPYHISYSQERILSRFSPRMVLQRDSSFLNDRWGWVVNREWGDNLTGLGWLGGLGGVDNHLSD